MSAARDPCPDCQLPFYTDRNSECPYCGATAEPAGPTREGAGGDELTATEGEASAPTDTVPAGTVARTTPPERPRTRCSNCGLPHYADDGNGCPYCASAGVTTDPEPDWAADTGSAATSESPQPPGSRDRKQAGSGSSDGSGGLLASLKRLVGR